MTLSGIASQRMEMRERENCFETFMNCTITNRDLERWISSGRYRKGICVRRSRVWGYGRWDPKHQGWTESRRR